MNDALPLTIKTAAEALSASIAARNLDPHDPKRWAIDDMVYSYMQRNIPVIVAKKKALRETPHLKKCSKCKTEKEASEFCKGKKKDGLRSWCKDCTNEYNRKYRAVNPEKIKEQYRKRYQANPEKAKERSREWKQTNPECRFAWRASIPIKVLREAIKNLLPLTNLLTPPIHPKEMTP